jgi:hypothetical protein
MLAAILPVLGPILGQVAKSVFPNAEDEIKRLEIQARLQEALIANQAQIEAAATEVIKAEAEGESWLQRNWRPLTMMVFVTLIVAKWTGYTAPGVSEALELRLLGLIEIGLGGYVIGRSVEKVAPVVAQALSRTK